MLAPVTDSRLLGKTLPECFFKRWKADPSREIYSTKKDGRWVAKTYDDCFKYIRQVIAGLQAIGFKKDDTLCIFAENREEWLLTDYACQWLGGKTTAIYTTSTPEEVRYILEHSETSVFVVSKDSLLKRCNQIEGLSKLKYLVAWDEIPNPPQHQGVQFLAHQNFLKSPISVDEAEKLLNAVKPEDMAIILYTSGTTGEPKGVVLTHFNFISDIAAMLNAVPQLTSDKVTISFLPLCHIYERSLHNLFVHIGVKIHFAESIDKLVENLAEIRPEVMIAVPRIFEKMYVKIHDRIKNAPWIRKEIFHGALAVGKKAFDYRYHGKSMPLGLKLAYEIADRLVFKKIRAITGGRADLFISGGAPLSVEIAEFFYMAGFTILEGYGLSETIILSCNMPGRIKIGSVGQPFKSVECKIAEDGEILVRGPMVMKGYYKKPKETAEVIEADGWFHTGDIGEIDSQGFLKITDRKKDLIVTAGGKKIAPQPIENSLKGDPLIEASCLLGDRKKYIVALIAPNLELCKTWGQKKGVSIQTLEDCAKNPQLRAHFAKEIEDLNKTLPQYSTIKDFRVVTKPFTMETGELTPTLKLKRRVIQERHSSLIDEMYPADDAA